MNLERINCQRLGLYAVRLNDSHLVLIDRERISIMRTTEVRSCLRSERGNVRWKTTSADDTVSMTIFYR